MTKFLLLLGPSGVGKSSIIEELVAMDSRFVYISPFITRPLRPGEKNKVFISGKEMEERSRRGEFLVINELYGGIRYATPELPIRLALAEGNFPVLDWPVSRIRVMQAAFPDRLHVVYVLPPSIEALRRRIMKDDRDVDGRRLREAIEELNAHASSQYEGLYDFEIVVDDGQTTQVAKAIYVNYLRNIR